MKHRNFAIAITFFFGIATYILVRKIGTENAKVDKETVANAHSPVSKELNHFSSTRKKLYFQASN